jgi:hypothetical protein
MNLSFYFINATFHIESLLGITIHFAIQNCFEGADGVGTANEFSWYTCKSFSNEEWLALEVL